jgi:3-oxoacyl-[acyl-carrier-protein] synthase II
MPASRSHARSSGAPPDGRRCVVVTGLGPVSCVGIGIDAFAAALRAGRSGISAIRSFDTTGFPHINAGEVHDFEPGAIVERIDPAAWGRSSLFAAAAARLAVRDAGLDLTAADPERGGVVMGTTCGETQVVERLTAQILEHGYGGMSPGLVRQLPAQRIASAVSEEIGFRGESVTLGAACAASNHALALALDAVASGEADVMIAGGSESVCRFVHAGFFRLGILAPESCAPFDRHRRGLITAEGGAALVMESLEHALARGARPYMKVIGCGLNCDAMSMTAGDTRSIVRCMRLAHRNARIDPSQVTYISAHGTGTTANDLTEVQAIRAVWGADPPPLSSVKSMIGHTMGAASGFGAIASAVAIRQRFIPPTINWVHADPALEGIDPVPNKARAADVRIVQNNGFGFGGNNAILLFEATE